MSVDYLYKTFIEKFYSLLKTCASLKKISKNKLKFKDKPWIKSGLQKSISIKSHYFLKFIIFKDPTKKNEGHKSYKY